MNALLLIAHGSRRQASNEEIETLACNLEQQMGEEFEIVKCAFLELAEPSIPDGVSACVAKGAKNVTVLPYFLSAGRHVATDIPNEIEKARQVHPNIEIKTTPYLGSAKEITSILLSLSKQAS